MILNAGWSRTVKVGKKRKREWKNTANIVVDLPDEAWDDDWTAVKEALMAHRPEGDGWMLAGYSRAVCAATSPVAMAAANGEADETE